MRASKLLLATLKETPADAEVISHQYMLRAGMIRKVATGIYNLLPLGLRVVRKIEHIVREEMNRAEAQELLMPAVQPAELWEESGRWVEYGPELLRFKDRHQRDFCLGPTHEEVVTNIVRNEIKSYRQLPLNLYHIQTKFRDEIRPRFGVMRAREFIMKDAYSFDVDQAGLEASYERMYRAYERIFSRCGLEFRAVSADSGAIGGSTSHEFHVLAESGEDAIAVCSRCDYAANVELAEAVAPEAGRPAPAQDLETVDTPDQLTVERVARFLGVPTSKVAKTLLVRGSDGGAVALIVRGDHELNAVKAEKLSEVAKPLEFIQPGEVSRVAGCDVGSIGPRGLKVPVIADRAASRMSDFVCGANAEGQHLTGVNWGRDLADPRTEDIRKVTSGDPCPGTCKQSGASLEVKRGIEVGHVFQLGTKYSRSMNATCLDEQGNSVIIEMGCYGIGITRIAAAVIEQHHDDHGIIWPDSIAPFEIAVAPIGMKKSEAVRDAAETVYTQLNDAGFDVLIDDRNERPGVMFAELDLIGVPHRLVVGDRGLKNGFIEYKHRRASQAQELPVNDIVETLKTLKDGA
jgi:prolyl-tRNA synthetase